MRKFSKKYILGESIKYILDFIKKSQKRDRDYPQRNRDIIRAIKKQGHEVPNEGMHKFIETEQIKSKAGGIERRIQDRRNNRSGRG